VISLEKDFRKLVRQHKSPIVSISMRVFRDIRNKLNYEVSFDPHELRPSFFIVSMDADEIAKILTKPQLLRSYVTEDVICGFDKVVDDYVGHKKKRRLTAKQQIDGS